MEHYSSFPLKLRLDPYRRSIISLIEAGLCGCNELGNCSVKIDRFYNGTLYVRFVIDGINN